MYVTIDNEYIEQILFSVTLTRAWFQFKYKKAVKLSLNYIESLPILETCYSFHYIVPDITHALWCVCVGILEVSVNNNGKSAHFLKPRPKFTVKIIYNQNVWFKNH